MPEEINPIKTQPRRLVSVNHYDRDTEVIFVETELEELFDQLLSSMFGRLILRAAEFQDTAEEERILLNFSEEVGTKEIPIKYPKKLIEIIDQSLEEKLNDRLKTMGLRFSYLEGECHLEFILQFEGTSADPT